MALDDSLIRRRIEALEKGERMTDRAITELARRLRVLESARPLGDDTLENIRRNSRQLPLDYVIAVDPTTNFMSDRYFHIDQDGPFELTDVMCSREDVMVEILDAGSNRYVVRSAGPWLRRREVALADLLRIANDAVGSEKSAHEIIREAIESAKGLATTVWFAPNSAMQPTVQFLSDAARADANIRVWLRGIKYVNL